MTALTPVDGNDPGQLNLARCAATARPTRTRSRRCTSPSPPERSGRTRSSSRPRSCDEAASQAPIDLAKPDRQGTAVVDVPLPDRRPRRPLPGISTVECFATFKKGFCQYYAATMAVILRDMGIPTRIAEGFLPGSREPERGDRADPVQQRPRLGRGLLPGLRLGHVRPDRRQRSQLAPLPSGQPDRERLASTVPSIPGRPGRSPRERETGGRRDRPAVPDGAALARSARRRAGAAAAGRRRRRVPRPGSAGRAAATTPTAPTDGDPDRVAVRVRAAAEPDRLRVRRRRSARSCRLSGRSSRPSPGPRSSRPTPARSSATSGSRACGRPSAGCGSSLLRLAFRRKERRRRR